MEDGQYAYPDHEHFAQGVFECDRAMLVGHLEPVPSGLVDWALTQAPAHPWTVVHQLADKWRAAQYYSRFTNGRVGSKPFTLPSVWDAGEVVKEGSYFAKYDLRECFWAVKVALESRPYVMVRHPATGRLLWCKSLPFGYKLPPLIFCDFRGGGAGIPIPRGRFRNPHLRVRRRFLDLIGDDKQSTVKGMEMLEALLDELGLQWAVHKRRGPARAMMEFLGFLMINGPIGSRIAISEGRHSKLTSLIKDWLRPRPLDLDESEGRAAEADPKELASLLGLLVFC